MTRERVVGRFLADLKSQKALFEALRCAQWLKNEREMVLVFHQNDLNTLSARLIAPGSGLVGFWAMSRVTRAPDGTATRRNTAVSCPCLLSSPSPSASCPGAYRRAVSVPWDRHA